MSSVRKQNNTLFEEIIRRFRTTYVCTYVRDSAQGLNTVGKYTILDPWLDFIRLKTDLNDPKTGESDRIAGLVVCLSSAKFQESRKDKTTEEEEARDGRVKMLRAEMGQHQSRKLDHCVDGNQYLRALLTFKNTLDLNRAGLNFGNPAQISDDSPVLSYNTALNNAQATLVESIRMLDTLYQPGHHGGDTYLHHLDTATTTSVIPSQWSDETQTLAEYLVAGIQALEHIVKTDWPDCGGEPKHLEEKLKKETARVLEQASERIPADSGRSGLMKALSGR